MIFKSTKYKLGAGKNFHGVMKNGKITLLYLSLDPSETLVKGKVIERKAGYIEAKPLGLSIEAKEVIPLDDFLIASRGEDQVKMLFMDEFS